jgi:hypothetical protein
MQVKNKKNKRQRKLAEQLMKIKMVVNQINVNAYI